MNRPVRILLHLAVFAIGITAVAYTNFWDWELLRGMVLPLVATGFFFYLVLFLAFRGYRDFFPSSS